MASNLNCASLFQLFQILEILWTVSSAQALSNDPVSVDVFTPGEGGCPCIRIPSIVETPNHTLVAFAECRTWTGDGCEPNSATSTRIRTRTTNKTKAFQDDITKQKPNINMISNPENENIRYICSKRSFDNGQTWSNLSFPFGNPINNPNFTSIEPSVIYDYVSNKIILQFNGNYGNKNQSIYQSYSYDNGYTWTNPKPIIIKNANTSNPVENLSKIIVGPGRGLQLLSNSSKINGKYGRILHIGYIYVNPNNDIPTAIVWFSDDFGQTYNFSNTIMFEMDEGQLVELNNGNIMANMRNNDYNFNNSNYNPTCDCQGISISNNSGISFSKPIGNNQLISPVCQASIISEQSDPNVLYFSNPNSKSERVNMTVKKSIDNGNTWIDHFQVYAGPSAYSCLTTVTAIDGYLGLLWETNTTNCVGPSCKVVFSLIPK